MPACIEKVKDYPKDLNPSTFCIMMAYSGVALEISCGWACAFGATRMIGVAMATTLHAYIISMLPFASVMEWNVYCLWYGRCLFNHLMKVEDCGAKGSEPFDSRTLLCGGPPPHSPPPQSLLSKRGSDLPELFDAAKAAAKTRGCSPQSLLS